MDNQMQVIRRAIKDAEKETNIELVNIVKNFIINDLRKDKNVDVLFCDDLEDGAYENNLKVLQNEFAFAIPLQLPSEEVRVLADKESKGNVLINLSLTKRSKYKFLEPMLNGEGFLLVNKFQSWFEGRMTKSVQCEFVTPDGVHLHLKYSKKLPVHTVTASGGTIAISIKFIPLFLFEATKSSAKRKVTTYWEAIPKPNNIASSGSFTTSYIAAENASFTNKNNLRCALKLMMKFRNSRPNMRNLKSYHLKSIFLWINKERGCAFWKATYLEIFRELFTRLQASLEAKRIQFFWDPELNLLDDVRNPRIESMNEEVKATLQVLTQPIVDLQHIFLTLEEQTKYNLSLDPAGIDVNRICQAVCTAINIDKNRQEYTKIYDFVRDAIIRGLKTNDNFKTIFSDLKLAGSYADNLKISKPDEFDLIVRLKIPHNELVEISPDSSNRGNVLINLNKVLERLLEENNYEMHKFLKKLLNGNKFLLQDKVQSWLEGLVSRYVSSINNEMTYVDGSKLEIKYSKQGPAHTITVKVGGNCKFSVDFVPGFCFDAKKSTSKRPVPKADIWEAIPKPIKGVTSNPSFRTSFADSERSYFLKKNQFKNVARLMKKYRDMNPKLVHLKSYFIKTLFLWHNETCDPGFWCKPTFEILREMFDVVENALKRKEIKFFWDDELNMLDTLTGDQVNSMYHHVKATKQLLKNANSTEDFLRIFLTTKEINQLKQSA